jgi:chaperonin GroES
MRRREPVILLGGARPWHTACGAAEGGAGDRLSCQHPLRLATGVGSRSRRSQSRADKGAYPCPQWPKEATTRPLTSMAKQVAGLELTVLKNDYIFQIHNLELRVPNGVQNFAASAFLSIYIPAIIYGCISRADTPPVGMRVGTRDGTVLALPHKFSSEESVDETASIAGPCPGSPCRAGSESRWGIFIPDIAQKKPRKRAVIAFGRGRHDEEDKVSPLDVKSSDRVLFGTSPGIEVERNGDDLMIMRQADITGALDRAVTEIIAT